MLNKYQSFKDLKSNAKIYFVGIAGISMSGLAELSQQLGYIVAGSDPHPSKRGKHLQSLNILLHEQHHPQWIDDFMPDLVVYTAAIPDWNVELVRAKELGIQCVDRSIFLGWLTRSFDAVINIAGTHGKTSTTAMCSSILIESKLNPTVHLGAEYAPFGSSTVLRGEGSKLLVSEACEYKKSLLNFHSTTGVLLNIDADHLDCYKDLNEIIETFASFLSEIPENGNIIYEHKGEHTEACLNVLSKKLIEKNKSMPSLQSFGILEEAFWPKEVGEDEAFSPELREAIGRNDAPDWAAVRLSTETGFPSFEVWHNARYFCNIQLPMPGLHFVKDALAAIAAAYLEGANPKATSKALSNYQGAEGRFSFIGHYKGASVYSDYAHHPTAVKETIKAAKTLPAHKLWLIFQPLTFDRVKQLGDAFAEALMLNESCLLYEIFSDREQNTQGMSSRLLEEKINKKGGQAKFMASFPDIVDYLNEHISSDDLILFMGPSQVRHFADDLIALEKQ